MFNEIVLVECIEINQVSMVVWIGSDATGSKQSGNVRMEVDGIGICQSFDENLFRDTFAVVRNDGVVGESIESRAGRADCEASVSRL